MWKMKLKVKHNDCPVVNRLEKFGLDVLSYPGTWYGRGAHKHVNHICFLKGTPQAKTAFLNDFKADPDVVRFEVEGDLFVYEFRLHKGGQHVQLYYNNEMMFVEPVLNSHDGYEYWHVASWDKSVLTRFYADLLKNMDFVEMLSFGQSQLKNVYFPNIMPKLSPGQLRALTLAYENGYYSYPRNVTLRKLAALAGVSLSTFQESLRKAEAALLPKLVELHVSSGPQMELLLKARLKKDGRRS